MSLRRAATTRRSHTLRLACALLSLAFVLTLLLQLQPTQVFAQDEPDEVVRVRTDLVTIPVFVTDGRGRRVPGLAQSDFELRDDGRRVEAAYFAAGAEHVSLLFLLDASGSTRDIINEQRETALAVFSRFGPRSRVAVMQFRERPELTLPFTDDLRRAHTAFQIAALPDRRTAIFDAALAAARAFVSGQQNPTERRIVILFSEGLDTASTTRPDA